MLRPTPRAFGVVLAAWTAGCAPLHDDVTTAADDEPITDTEADEAEHEIAWGELEPHATDPAPRCWTGATPSEAVAIDDPFASERGELIVRRDGVLAALPLQETAFDTVVVGTVAQTSVIQTFNNPFPDAIEAVYVFPLPHDGAVDDYWIRVGERNIHGVMKTREQARETYEQAREEGRAAGLLEQERPNVFTQSVANIPPGGSIEVEMRVVHPLRQVHGRYELALPTVVGPRFIPGTPIGRRGGGWSPDTDRVPDASRITPPVVPPGKVGCARLAISVVLDPGLPIHDLRSLHHRVVATPTADGAAVELGGLDELPNRDFVLSWELSGPTPRASLMAHKVGDEGWFTLTVQPPAVVRDDQARPRELVFVLDTSGSMSGRPIETAKAAVRRSLEGMGARDRFQVLDFSDTVSALGDGTLLAATPENVERGLAHLDTLDGGGGTQMVEGIKAALDLPGDPERMRIVLFLTDGYIGNEAEIFAEIQRRRRDARLFSLGVGDAVNRYLLDGMARTGRGTVTYMALDEDPAALVDRFYETIDRPVLTDVEIDWNGLPVEDVVPAQVPDVFAGQPVVVYGRFTGSGRGTATLRGRAGGQPVALEVPFDTATRDDTSGLASLWARRRIDDLLGWPAHDPNDATGAATAVAAATELALRHRVMTQYTSFVAVDEQEVTNPDGTTRTLQVPVELPRGVEHEAWGALVGTEIGESFGVGGLGLIGKGKGGGGTAHGGIATGTGTGSGYGRGSGAGLGGRGKRVPTVRTGKAEVMGSIDKDVIRRVVRRHLAQVRACWEQTLTIDPSLSGRVVLEMVIDEKGRVISATLVENPIGDAALGQCIERAARSWRFPGFPGGSAISVRYPFTLQPG
jgi:Ca-activated chloride channel family protein